MGCTSSPGLRRQAKISLRNLTQRGVRVTVLPPDVHGRANPGRTADGLFVSKRPGRSGGFWICGAAIQGVMGKVPSLGICLGHQLLGRAIGAGTYKLKFGHRGAKSAGEEPPERPDTKITSQNHGFCRRSRQPGRAAAGGDAHQPERSNRRRLPPHDDAAVFVCKYTPRPAPGPHDARMLFDAFVAD